MNERVSWNTEEIEALAQAIVTKRIANPFVPPIKLLKQAQVECLAEHRRRALPRLGACAALKRRVVELWRARLAPAEPIEPPPPQIIQVEVPKPIDWQEVMGKLDIPSLAALLLSRLGAEWHGLSTSLADLAGKASGHTHHRAAHVPSMVRLAAPEPAPKLPRVAVIGPLDSQFAEIKQQVAQFSRPVELRCFDKEISTPAIPLSCDCVVITKHSRRRWFEAAQAAVGNSRVYFVDGGTTQVVQKLRDIASMKW